MTRAPVPGFEEGATIFANLKKEAGKDTRAQDTRDLSFVVDISAINNGTNTGTTGGAVEWHVTKVDPNMCASLALRIHGPYDGQG